MTEENKPEGKKKSAIDIVTKHFQGKVAGVLKHHHVEAWGLDVYFRPTTTLKQEARIVELSQQNKTVEALVETIIIKALDEAGNPLFTQYDKAALMNEADPTVVLALARVLNNNELPTVDEAEKNS